MTTIFFGVSLKEFHSFRDLTQKRTRLIIMVNMQFFTIVRRRLLKIENYLPRGLISLAAALEIIIVLYAFQRGEINYFINFTLILVQLFLGLYLLAKNFKNEINFSFGAFCFSLALWTFEVLM